MFTKRQELGEVINTETLHQELEQERQLNGMDDTSGETNPYRELIINNVEKTEPLLAQMEQWSLLSNTLNYIQYDRHPKNYHRLGISAVIKYGKNQGLKEERDTIVTFWFKTRYIKGRIFRHVQRNTI